MRAASLPRKDAQRRLVASLAGRPHEPIGNDRPREMIATRLWPGTEFGLSMSLARESCLLAGLLFWALRWRTSHRTARSGCMCARMLSPCAPPCEARIGRIGHPATPGNIHNQATGLPLKTRGSDFLADRIRSIKNPARRPRPYAIFRSPIVFFDPSAHN